MSEQINMGLGELGNPTTTFVRKFRWTFDIDGLKGDFVKKVNINYHNRLINFEIYDVLVGDKLPAIDWIENNRTRIFKDAIFTTYDGCGNPIYSYKFFDLEINGRSADFDMGSSEESTQKVSMKYHSSKRGIFAEKLNFGLPMRETQIDRLNARTWVY